MDSIPNLRAAQGCQAVILCAAEDVRDLMIYWLASVGVPSVVNPSGEDANRLLSDSSCRLLVTDHVLPLWPGLNTFLQLRSANPKLRISFVDDGNAHTARLASLTGATSILRRPLTRKSLIDALDRVDMQS